MTTGKERYDEAVALGRTPSAEAAARLVALLEDNEEVCVSEGCSLYDVDATYDAVSTAARDALARMGAFVWPAIADAWPNASVGGRRSMIYVLTVQPFELRARFPDDAYLLLVEEAERIGDAQRIAVTNWERAFATRVRNGELADPEAFWRAAQQHPSAYESDRSFVMLAAFVKDPVALAREILEQLASKDVRHQKLVSALLRLPPVMPAELVESTIASDVVHQHMETWPWLARHGESARGLIPLCVSALTQSKIGDYTVTIAKTADARRWRLAAEAIKAFDPLDADVRATLLDRLATTNETMSLEGSLRKWLCELLGDVDEIEAMLAPRLEEMEKSGDPVAAERVRQLRHRFSVMRQYRS